MTFIVQEGDMIRTPKPRKRLRFKKDCLRCGKSFRPAGKACKLCENCILMSRKTPNGKPSRLRRPCKICDKYFDPFGKHSWMCERCKIKKHQEDIKHKNYRGEPILNKFLENLE